MPLPLVHSTVAQKVCAAGGLSLNLLQINAPATIIGATAISAFLEVSTHFEIVNELTYKVTKAKLAKPKVTCRLHGFKKPQCDWTYEADFECPGAEKRMKKELSKPFIS
ncbi:hypothetical protein CBS101457_005226 [Exobasidium rhododendri]|nr:hypothetical protein CBS101457_005226 [Exobasidium rhododendri]